MVRMGYPPRAVRWSRGGRAATTAHAASDVLRPGALPDRAGQTGRPERRAAGRPTSGEDSADFILCVGKAAVLEQPQVAGCASLIEGSGRCR